MEALSIRSRDDAQDLATLLPILQRVYDLHQYPVHGQTDEMFLAADPVQHSWVAVRHDRIIGNISVSRPTLDDPSVASWRKGHPDDNIAVLGKLFVDPDVAGGGVAQQLIHHVVAWAVQCQTRLVLFALLRNTRLGALYEKLGWVKFAMDVYTQPDGVQWDVACYASPLSEEK